MDTKLPWPFYTEPKWIDVHGLKTAYRREGAGEPVLYLHGNGMTRRWLPFYEELSRSVDLIVPDHPGFGDTEMPEWLDNFSDVVLHYAELLDTLGLEKVHVIGHSFGGWIAAEFASFYPERLKSLQLLTPAGLKGANLHDSFRQSGEEALERIFNGGADKYAEYTDDGDPTESLISNYKQQTTVARLAWQPRHNIKLPRRLGRVTAPTQVILPDEDRILNADVMRKYAEYIPGATLASISNPDAPTSHVPFVQAPKALAEMLSGFVAAASKD
ncbi:MAG: alpha/beta hydrolase [Rhodobacteraceae bacterium]|jgi:pimeloyl-ACP methyl ester carboxylesterase|nr:alpha/beta hydrolase [Paracoccaceae bacterium]